MTTKEIIDALRCSASANGMEHCDGCPYFYRDEPSPEIAEQYGNVRDDFWNSCDVDRIALDAAARLEELEGKTMRDDELMFYLECWREMQSFLAEVVRDNTGEYPFAQDVLDLMKSIERKFERC